MKERFTMAILIATSVLTIAAAPSFARPYTKAPVRYYLSLGDSLAVGYQPNAVTGVGAETNQGYANQLYTIEKKSIPTLKLVKFGCPGDTTGSLLTGKGNATSAKKFHCDRAGGSQLKAAESFIKAHHAKGEIALITLDIGANDVDGCASSLKTIGTCVTDGINLIKKNTPKILAGLRKAAPAGTKLAAMNLYDPFLAFYLQPYNVLNGLSLPSVGLAQEVDTAIGKADAAAKFLTADVFTAFSTSNETPELYNGAQVPTDVVQICKLTWMCKPKPVGPNIHANQAGYAVIAGAFNKVLGKL